MRRERTSAYDDDVEFEHGYRRATRGGQRTRRWRWSSGRGAHHLSRIRGGLNSNKVAEMQTQRRAILK